VNTIYYDLREKLTPIKILSIITICLATIDGIFVPINLDRYNILIDPLIKLFLFFIGFFGLFGNGRTKRIRATAVSIPFLYFGIYEMIKMIQTQESHFLLSIIIFLILGLWVLLFGDKYE
jgi:hypothetical protein